MIRVSVFYPKSDGCTFDHDYYRTTHVPMAVKAWSPRETSIDVGIDGPYIAAVHFVFDSIDQFHTGMASPMTSELMADLVNYTNITDAVIQVAEIVAN